MQGAYLGMLQGMCMQGTYLGVLQGQMHADRPVSLPVPIFLPSPYVCLLLQARRFPMDDLELLRELKDRADINGERGERTAIQTHTHLHYWACSHCASWSSLFKSPTALTPTWSSPLYTRARALA